VREVFGDLERVPEELLLWFHHVPWDHRTSSGRTLWQELLHRYQRGVERVRDMQATWKALRGKIDDQRHAQVRDFLAIQEKEPRWWRDACVRYFQSLSKRPIPDDYELGERSLEQLQAIEHRCVPGWRPPRQRHRHPPTRCHGIARSGRPPGRPIAEGGGGAATSPSKTVRRVRRPTSGRLYRTFRRLA
jgi:hypothetical protein